MLADNVVWLKKNMPYIYQQVKAWEDNKDKVASFIIETAKDGNETLKYQTEEKNLFMHSKYNPIREAEVLTEKFIEKEVVSGSEQVIFFGLGLGYHIERFVRKFPDIRYIIIEPSIEILDLFLDRIVINDLFRKNLKLIQCKLNPAEIFNTITHANERSVLIFEHPVYPQIFRDSYNQFMSSLKEIIKVKRSSFHTNIAFEKRWILNCVNNLKEILKTPNILLSDREVFQGKDALLVAAGPSLNFEFENLRKIKNEEKAFIFTVGSAINALLDQGIFPDAMVTIDPGIENQLVFKKINQMKITNIPMIFGSSVGHETFDNFAGLKAHFITSQDSLARFFLKPKNEKKLRIISDAPSVAIATLELLYQLGFKRVFLVGQNLAYFNNKHYAEGIFYPEFGDIDTCDEKLTVEDVYGNQTATNNGFFVMKAALETMISQIDIEVINTTKGGAKINGAMFRTLEELLESNLIEKEPNVNKFVTNEPFQYEESYLEQQVIKMRKDYESFCELLERIKGQIAKIDNLILNQNKKELTPMYQKLDQSLHALEKNSFAQIFALMINRIEYAIISKNIQATVKEKDEIRTVKKRISYIKSFISVLDNDAMLYLKIMNKIETDINSVMQELNNID
jgi:hypothetical protein